MREAVIVSAVRTAVGKAPRGTLKTTRPDDMAAAVINEVLCRSDIFAGEDIEDALLKCAFPDAQWRNNLGAAILSFL